MDLKGKGMCQRMRKVTAGPINNGITFNLIATALECIYHAEVSMVLFVIMRVCVTLGSAVSASGGNGKQELCGRCLCSRRSSVLLPRQRSCLFEDLLSLLRHTDETADQRARCIPSFITTKQNKQNLLQKLIAPNHTRYINISHIADKHGTA